MRVQLDAALFEGPDIEHLNLISLIALCTRMGHWIMLEPTARRQWCERHGELGDVLEELLKSHMAESASMSAHSKLIEVVPAERASLTDAKLSLREALDFFLYPLEVLLENERGDWGFLCRLASAHQRSTLDTARARRQLLLRHAGGLPELIKILGALSADESLIYRRCRTWVMFDRDADSRGDRTQPSKEARDALEKCEKADQLDGMWPFSYRMLQRRHIESYLPSAVLQSRYLREPQKASAAALAEIRSSHTSCADSMDMKSGLLRELSDGHKKKVSGRTQSHEAPKRQEALSELPDDAWPMPFDALSPELRADLINGFGKDCADLFADDSLDDELFREEYARDGESAETFINSILDML